MCIIVYKPAGASVPEHIIKNCYSNNPDGAGVVWYDASASALRLHKALMTEAAALRVMAAIPTDAPAILHFRITTHGTDAKRQTHPFVLSSNIKSVERLQVNYKGYAVAHNGVFSGVSLGAQYSDTEAFIIRVLAPLAKLCATAGASLIDDEYKDIITMAMGTSKLAIMAPTGEVKLYGLGWQHDDDTGLFFSNMTWRYRRVETVSYYNWLPHKTDVKARAKDDDAGELPLYKWERYHNWGGSSYGEWD